MASLTHVCMWSATGWKRITAYEAAKMHPGGTVSAYSGLFMCELCGQYVTLTNGRVQVSHFRHSSSEKSKNCPERTGQSSSYYSYSFKQHELPIKLLIKSNSIFELLLGFIKVPGRFITPKLKISIAGKNISPRVYSRERINIEGITYLPLGSSPCETYNINIAGCSEEIFDYWPKTVTGINPGGTLFDGLTGKKLVQDSDVEVGKKYFLLKRGGLALFSEDRRHILAKEICRCTILWEHWIIYEISAKDYHEISAKFFLEYHCRLTDTPVALQTVWPVYIESPYLIRFNKPSILALLRGNAPNTRTFPSAVINQYDCPSENNKVIEVLSNHRQQLISAGRTNALQYSYFWREPLSHITEKINIQVKTLSGKDVNAGLIDMLPDDKTLSFTLPFDGLLLIKMGKTIVERRKIDADSHIVLNNISWGISVSIYIGLDLIWKVEFHKRQKDSDIDEAQLLRRFQLYSDPPVRISHMIGGLANSLEHYPLLRAWLLKRIRDGYVSKKALQEIQALAHSDIQ